MAGWAVRWRGARPGWCLVLPLALLLAAACALLTPGPGHAAGRTHLLIRIAHPAPGPGGTPVRGPWTARTLDCGPPGGTLARSHRACRVLLRRPGLMRPLRRAAAPCPSRRVWASVRGSWRGRHVGVDFAGCASAVQRRARIWASLARGPAATRPVVWVQAGHVAPREPGYRVQTGAGAGAFGSEIGFTSNLAPKVIARLRRSGVDARFTPGEVLPLGSRGAVFISLHYDTPQGHPAIGYAVTGGGENYYHGEGVGTPSPVPYPDSAPHRAATTVSAAVSARSRELAVRLSRRYRAIFTRANGARSSYGGVQSATSNPRVMHYYGFYRTNAAARVIIECGAGVTDDAFLSRTGLIAGAISAGIVDYLHAHARLGG